MTNHALNLINNEAVITPTGAITATANHHSMTHSGTPCTTA